MAYEWGIESSAASESGCLAGGTGCGHNHPSPTSAQQCLARQSIHGITNGIVARSDGGRLSDDEWSEILGIATCTAQPHGVEHDEEWGPVAALTAARLAVQIEEPL